MIAPILFVDEKLAGSEYRFLKLKNKFKEHSHVIEFMGDLDLEYHLNEYTGEIDYTPNPYLETRKIVFIHASLDTPKYPESVINKAKEIHKNTIFVKFSNGRDPNSRIENLIFNRDEHIYNQDKERLQKGIEYINTLIHKEEYFAMLERYVKKIIEQASADTETLKNLHL